MPSFISRFLGGWKISLACLAIGIAMGGYGVHKLYQAGEVASLKHEIERRDKADKARNQVAAELAASNATREQQLVATIEGLQAHAQSLSACHIDGDVGRLLNQHR
ncbi:MAG: hypothetical protein JJ939_11980 [Alphaproteobacteria bacterium]|nr:hypothetical protein [Alphaproteobacteria bacterium]MBO6629132.1 hypothetical protein [Alphaproteobacteria bacterium]